MAKFLVTVAALALASVSAAGQNTAPLDVPDTVHKTSRPAWVSGHDAWRAGEAFVAVGFLSLADERIAQGSQRGSLQNSHALSNAADVIQVVGDPGAFLVSSTLFVAGKLSHHEKLASASLRSIEAIAASGAITQALKLSIGRARPNITGDQNAYAFHPLHGAQTDFNSFPSGHSSASFAAATVFSAEIQHAHPKAAKFTAPLLYGIATAVGGARLYNDRHWLSDVVGGALIGHFAGRKITSRVLR